MNLNPLYELKERLESSVIAGVSLLSEDFRLKRAVEQMEPLSKAAPVFAKIFQDAKELYLDTCENKGAALLDVLSLVDAVLATQATASVEGELKPLALMEGTVVSNGPYSVIAPLLEALTTSGSGHYNLIVDAYNKTPEVFSDYRLKLALVEGLGAGYSELAQRIEEWLSKEDASFLPVLKNGFDPKGKKEMARRIHVVEAIAGAKENEWYLSLLEEAEKEVRAAAIYALRRSPENQDRLTGLVKTEKGSCKKAALLALANMEGAENWEFWEKQIKKKPSATVKYLAFSTKDTASDLVADTIKDALDELKRQVDGGNVLLSNKDYEQLQPLFMAMIGKASSKMLEVYRELASDSLFGRMKMEQGCPVKFSGNDMADQKIDMPVSHYIARVLMDSILWSMDKRLLSLAEELYQAYGSLFLKPALAAAFLTKPKEEVYRKFSQMLVREEATTRETIQEKAERMDSMEIFSWILWRPDKNSYAFYGCFQDEMKERPVFVFRKLPEGLDARWFTLLTHPKLKKSVYFPGGCNYYMPYMQGYYSYGSDWDAALERLICPQNEEICQILSHYFYNRLLTAKSSGDDRRYYVLLKQCGFTKGRGLLVKSLQRKKVQAWAMEDMLLQAPMPLEDKLEELEEVKRLVDSGKIGITGWSEERYQKLHDRLSVDLGSKQAAAEKED